MSVRHRLESRVHDGVGPLPDGLTDQLGGIGNGKVRRTSARFLSRTARQTGTIVALIGNHRYQSQDIADAARVSAVEGHSVAIAPAGTA